MIFTRLILMAIAIVALGAQASAEVTTIPSGYEGAYRLVFVTNGTTNAESSNISTYNAFATAQANLNPVLAALGTNWYIMGSTLSTSLYQNIGSTPTTPLYRLDGVKVANGSGSADGLPPITASISVDQYGTTGINRQVWTGTELDGTGPNN